MQTIASWTVLSLVIGILAIIAVWSRRGNKSRMLAVVGLLLGIPVSGAALAFSLGNPLPYIAAFHFRQGGDFGVLGAKMIVGEGIYALLDVGGAPRYFVMPWDKDMASKLQDLMESQREGDTGEPRMKLPPMEFSWEKRKPPELYAMPQPKVLPQKPQPATPKHYENI
jgi:hypothetical protein